MMKEQRLGIGNLAGVIVVCPGVHSPQLTEAFLRAIALEALGGASVCIVPGDRLPVYAPLPVLSFLQQRLGAPWNAPPVLFLGFSAGVVGLAAVAPVWQALGGTVQGLIALDGWGVPLAGNFPIHRLSHDRFTDWSSALLDVPLDLLTAAARGDRFYAEPAVAHLDLWRSPHMTTGWWHSASGSQVFTTAAACLQALIQTAVAQ
ncbi:hypothetical protein [Leptolyngbya sp. O-77]|uniref:hypothetical protein n=1 Tax=Leptolyngbya sp. O-77 TaxID=1080068 RepID=UPI00074D39F3|nr:hypothetical protein [Leptolyngbya sp. O-77]BAU44456.1 hypothetical protein O77CONTIG1_04296 [Leptolyngbya sp. O-77]